MIFSGLYFKTRAVLSQSVILRTPQWTKDLLTTRPRGPLPSLAVMETLRVACRGTVLVHGLRVTGLWAGNGAASGGCFD